MALLKNLKLRIKFWWKPTWEMGYSYTTELENLLMGHFHPPEVVFRITRGKYKGLRFTLKDIKLDDATDGSGDGIVSFETKYISGYIPKEIVCAIFQDALMRAIENKNQLQREVIDDRTEDSGMDYTEEFVDERRVCPPSTSIHKE